LANGVISTALWEGFTAQLGTSCIQIGVDNGNLVNGNLGKAALYQSLPLKGRGPNVIPVAAFFTGLTDYVVDPVRTLFIDTLSPVAIDTQTKVPCSTPPLLKVPTAGSVLGAVNQGTCNTISTFSNGGTGIGVGGNVIPWTLMSAL